MDRPDDTWLSDRFCSNPFEQVDTQPNQDIHFCPAAWQPAAIGNLSDDPETAWNSAKAQEIRRSVLEGDFSHCCRSECPRIAQRDLPTREEILSSTDPSPAAAYYREILQIGKTHLDTPPKRANLGHDLSGNTACPARGTAPVQLKKYDADRLDWIVNEPYGRFLSKAERITIGRDGEPFASRHFLNFLKVYCSGTEPRKTLDLHTNGLLLTEAVWNRLDLWGHVGSVHVSVDAATPGTYAALRPGRTLGQLMPNLYFLGHLRRLKAVDVYRLVFVVRQENYAEMPDFARLARRVGATEILFQRFRDQRMVQEGASHAVDVVDPRHADHDQLRLILEDPVLNAPDVDIEYLGLPPVRIGAPRAPWSGGMSDAFVQKGV
jgi:hypothetical protein